MKVARYGAVVVVVAALLVGGCSSDPTASEEYAELESQLATVTAERDQLTADLAESGALPEILLQFKAAYESGDLAQVQALYTEDGIWATTARVFELYHGQDSHLGTWGVNDSEFRRTATLHAGEMEIFNAVQVGDRAVAFGWRWSDFASGTGVLHLRDGKIAVASLAVTEVEILPAQ